jgi:hypothetical protein
VDINRSGQNNVDLPFGQCERRASEQQFFALDWIPEDTFAAY